MTYMKKIDKIKKNLEGKTYVGDYYNEDLIIRDAKRWIKATKDQRMLCVIKHVSKSGMSRDMVFLEGRERGFRNFFSFMRELGFKPTDNYSNSFRISGCGMDMVFHTNYTIIHRLHKLGFINKKQCEELAQMTPQTV